MSDFVRMALEAQLNANLRENIEAVRSAGFEVEGLVDGEAPLILRVRVAQLALPGPGAETQTPAAPPAGDSGKKARKAEAGKAGACKFCAKGLRITNKTGVCSHWKCREELKKELAGKK